MIYYTCDVNQKNLELVDCTTGVEYDDTIEMMSCTEMAIREVEDRHGFSLSNDDFLTACLSTQPVSVDRDSREL